MARNSSLHVYIMIFTQMIVVTDNLLALLSAGSTRTYPTSHSMITLYKVRKINYSIRALVPLPQVCDLVRT